MNRFQNENIRIFKHEKNKGVTAAKNTGLRNIKGEWFTILDSDDEIVPEAIETMINIPLNFDKSITAVTCNCLDTSSNEFAGKGLVRDQYLEVKTLMTICKGEFWGLTKTSLLKNGYFNENLSGFETVLWYKIDDRANRYYIHKPLRIYHTEGSDRISNTKYDFNKEMKLYTNLIDEIDYINKIKKYNPGKFKNICRNGLIVSRINHDKIISLKYYEYLSNSNGSLINKLILKYWIVAVIIKKLQFINNIIKPKLKFLLQK